MCQYDQIVTSLKNTLILILSLTTVSSAWIAWHQQQQIQSLSESKLTTSSSDKSRSPQKSIENTIPTTLTTAGDENSAIESPTASQTTPRNRRRALFLEATNSPEYKQLQQVVRMGRLDSRFAALYRKLNLPAEPLSRLKALIAERENVRTDIFAVAREQGLNIRENRETINQLIQENQNEVDATLREEFGETIYDTYQQFVTAERFWRVSDQLGVKLAYSPNPLTLAQKEQLVDILSRTNQQTQNRISPGLRDRVALEYGVDARTPISNDVLDQARGLLTPNQFQALQRMKNEQDAALKMAAIVRSKLEARNTDTIR